MSLLVGTNNTTGTTYTLNSNYAYYNSFIASSSGTAQTLYVYTVNTGATNVRGAIYDVNNNLLSLTSIVAPVANSFVALSITTPFSITAGDTLGIVFGVDHYQQTTTDASGAYTEVYKPLTDITVDTNWPNPWSSTASDARDGKLSAYIDGTLASSGPANGIPSLTADSSPGSLLSAGTSVTVKVDTTGGTNVYPSTPLTIGSNNKIPVIDLSSAVTAGTIANGDTVRYSTTYNGVTTIINQTVTASPT